MTGPKSTAPMWHRPWHPRAYAAWKERTPIYELAKQFHVDRKVIENIVRRGKEIDEHEANERRRAVKGEPLIPLPPLDEKMAACRLFAAGSIDIGELAKRLRGQR